MTGPRIGDRRPFPDERTGDCPATAAGEPGDLPFLCTRDDGHPPPHVAESRLYGVVAIWPPFRHMTAEEADVIADAEPPVDVRAVLDDGTEIPCELVYTGWANGAHVWATVTPIPVERLRRLTCARLPGRTSIYVGGT